MAKARQEILKLMFKLPDDFIWVTKDEIQDSVKQGYRRFKNSGQKVETIVPCKQCHEHPCTCYCHGVFKNENGN